MKIVQIAAILVSTLTGAAGSEFSPLQLTSGSYTLDIVVESNAPPPLPFCLSATQSGGTGMSGYTWYEQGCRLSPYLGTGVPGQGQTFTNVSNTNIAFKMAPDYLKNSALLIDSSLTNGTLTLVPATRATNLATWRLWRIARNCQLSGNVFERLHEDGDSHFHEQLSPGLVGDQFDKRVWKFWHRRQ